MAAFKHKGNTYFYANGIWMDSVSKRVSKEMELELNVAFPNPEARIQTNSKVQLEIKRKSNRFRRTTHGFKKATEKTYYRTAELTDDQKRALSVLESGKNVFLSGEAGTGKSFVLNEYIYRNRDKNIIVCAPTGIAAINIGGSTLHRVFKVPISVTRPGEYNAKPDNSLIKADVIIIDEISMCRFDIFEYVVRTIRKAEELRQKKENVSAMETGRIADVLASKQLIVVGDFFQLAPVVTNSDREILSTYWDLNKYSAGFAFQSDLWDELNFECVVLKEIIRQKGNVEYIENLNKIRRGDPTAIGWFNLNVKQTPMPNSIYLCGTNKAADEINQYESDKLEGKAVVYNSRVNGQVQSSDKMTSDSLVLKVGMQVMTLVNNVEEGYQNGSLGKIVALNSESVDVKLNAGKVVKVKPYDWEIVGYEVQDDKLEKVVLGNFRQIPLKIAYAITIHKSQGQTYSSANVSPDCFASGQLYVALSRVQTIDGMSLEHDIKPRALKTSSAVKEFYDNLKESETDFVPENIPLYIDEIVPENEDVTITEDKFDFEHTIVSKKASVYEKVQQMSDEEASACYMYKVIKEKPNAYAPWTDEEEEEMLAELEQGMKIGDIAKKHCRTNGAIRSRLKKIRER